MPRSRQSCAGLLLFGHMNVSVILRLPDRREKVPLECPLTCGQRTLLCVLAGIMLVLHPYAVSARTMKDQTGRSVNVPDNPRRLVSLAPNITEIVYALGLADELVGDTDQCDFPFEAKKKPHVGTMLNPSLEKIVALKADLVLGTPSANRRETADQLERMGIPLYGVTASTLAGTLSSIENLGQVLGHGPEADPAGKQTQNFILIGL